MCFAGLCSLLFERVANVSIGIGYIDKKETETGLSRLVMLTFALVEKQHGKKPTGKDILVLIQLTWHY